MPRGIARTYQGGVRGGGADELQTKNTSRPDLHFLLYSLPALSPCVVSSSLSEWHMQMDIIPDSTTDLYNLQVSPMPSTSEGLYLGPGPVLSREGEWSLLRDLCVKLGVGIHL